MEISQEVRNLLDQVHRFILDWESWTTQLTRNPFGDYDYYVANVEATYQRLKAGMGRSFKVLLRRIIVPSSPSCLVLVANLDSIVDTKMVVLDIIQPLLSTTLVAKGWNLPWSQITRRRIAPRSQRPVWHRAVAVQTGPHLGKSQKSRDAR